MKQFRCRSLLIVIVILNGVLTGRPAFAQQDDLFSSVRASTVFSEGDAAVTGSTTTSPVTNRLMSAEALVQVLQKAEFTAVASGSRAAVAMKQLELWQFPVLVTISEDEQDLLIAVGLRAVSDSQKLPAPRLLQLLEANQKASRASFVFNRDKGRLELLCQVRNTGEKDVLLRDEINRLAILARDMETVWNLDEKSGGSPIGAAGSAAIEATKVAPTTANPIAATPERTSAPVNTAGAVPELTAAALQGRWAASRSATEAFAMQLNNDSTFVLVSVIHGKQLRSSGKFALANGQLTLDGSDGVKIVGIVKLNSATEFQFAQQSAGVTGATLSFSKAP